MSPERKPPDNMQQVNLIAAELAIILLGLSVFMFTEQYGQQDGEHFVAHLLQSGMTAVDWKTTGLLAGDVLARLFAVVGITTASGNIYKRLRSG